MNNQQQKLIIIAVTLLLIVGVVIIILDWKNIVSVLGQAEWTKTAISLIYITLTYLCLSFGFTVVCRIFSIDTKMTDLVQIGFVSAALNNLLDFMGMGGHSLRLMLMQRYRIPADRILAASIFHSHLHNLGMFCLLPIGMLYLIAHGIVTGTGAVSLGLGTAVIIAFIVIATLVIFKQSLRSRLLNLITGLVKKVVRKNIGPFMNTFDRTMATGASAVREKPGLLILTGLFVVGEWAFMLIAFWYCFGALGNPVSPGVLITGFAVGISAGNMSLLPGGLVVQEGSMAGVYALMDVSVERGVLASILYRVVYDFIPFFISLGFYRYLLRWPVAKHPAEESSENS